MFGLQQVSETRLNINPFPAHLFSSPLLPSPLLPSPCHPFPFPVLFPTPLISSFLQQLSSFLALSLLLKILLLFISELHREKAFPFADSLTTLFQWLGLGQTKPRAMSFLLAPCQHKHLCHLVPSPLPSARSWIESAVTAVGTGALALLALQAVT